MASPIVVQETEIPRQSSSLARLIAMAWGGCLVAVLAEYPFGGLTSQHREQLWADQLVYGAAILAIGFLYIKLSGVLATNAGLTLGFQRRPSIGSFFLVIALSVALTFVFLVSRFLVFGRNYHLSLIRAVCICTLIPIGEELLFRGWFQAVLTRARPLFGEWQIALINAAVFAFAHYLRLLKGEDAQAISYTVLGAFVFGMIAMRARQRTGNLIIPVALHMVYNTTGTLLTQWLWTISRR